MNLLLTLLLCLPIVPTSRETVALEGTYEGWSGSAYLYDVEVLKDHDILTAYWYEPGGALRWVGRWEKTKEGWTETYLEDPNLNHAAPWRWTVEQQDPLYLVDHGPGWMLKRRR